MRTFTAEEIKSLRKDGKISGNDYLKLALAPKRKTEEPPAKSDILADIRDALNKIVLLGERQVAKPEEKIVVQSSAPVVNVSIPEEPEEETKKWNFTVKRDSRGYIESVSAVQVSLSEIVVAND